MFKTILDVIKFMLGIDNPDEFGNRREEENQWEEINPIDEDEAN